MPENETRQRLLDLAYDVSARLRGHSRAAVRVSAALLLAASLAACDGDPEPEFLPDTPPAVQPLQQEVARGLPTSPGRYPLVENSLQRDEQGVYSFAYRPDGGDQGAGSDASASRVRLARADSEVLEIPRDGDPILWLRPNSEVKLVSASMTPDGTPEPTPGTGSGSGRSGSSSHTSYTYWRPLYSTSSVSGPGYYDPPRAVASGAAVVDQARASTSISAPSERTFGVVHAVSGRAGGTGGGTAASSRAGAAVAAGGAAAGGVAAAKASGFSGGAASAKGGGSS